MKKCLWRTHVHVCPRVLLRCPSLTCVCTLFTFKSKGDCVCGDYVHVCTCTCMCVCDKIVEILRKLDKLSTHYFAFNLIIALFPICNHSFAMKGCFRSRSNSMEERAFGKNGGREEESICQESERSVSIAQLAADVKLFKSVPFMLFDRLFKVLIHTAEWYRHHSWIFCNSHICLILQLFTLSSVLKTHTRLIQFILITSFFFSLSLSLSLSYFFRGAIVSLWVVLLQQLSTALLHQLQLGLKSLSHLFLLNLFWTATAES